MPSAGRRDRWGRDRRATSSHRDLLARSIAISRDSSPVAAVETAIGAKLESAHGSSASVVRVPSARRSDRWPAPSCRRRKNFRRRWCRGRRRSRGRRRRSPTTRPGIEQPMERHVALGGDRLTGRRLGHVPFLRARARRGHRERVRRMVGAGMAEALGPVEAHVVAHVGERGRHLLVGPAASCRCWLSRSPLVSARETRSGLGSVFRTSEGDASPPRSPVKLPIVATRRPNRIGSLPGSGERTDAARTGPQIARIRGSLVSGCFPRPTSGRGSPRGETGRSDRPVSRIQTTRFEFFHGLGGFSPVPCRGPDRETRPPSAEFFQRR